MQIVKASLRKFLVGNKYFIDSLTRSHIHMYSNPAENLSIFCPCAEISRETYIRSTGLINLAKEISRQPNFQAVVWVL